MTHGQKRAQQAAKDAAHRTGTPPEGKLKAVTVYLANDEVERLNTEAVEGGRTGPSAQIRWILSQRRLEESSRLA